MRKLTTPARPTRGGRGIYIGTGSSLDPWAQLAQQCQLLGPLGQTQCVAQRGQCQATLGQLGQPWPSDSRAKRHWASWASRGPATVMPSDTGPAGPAVAQRQLCQATLGHTILAPSAWCGRHKNLPSSDLYI